MKPVGYETIEDSGRRIEQYLIIWKGTVVRNRVDKLNILHDHGVFFVWVFGWCSQTSGLIGRW